MSGYKWWHIWEFELGEPLKLGPSFSSLGDCIAHTYTERLSVPISAFLVQVSEAILLDSEILVSVSAANDQLRGIIFQIYCNL